MIRKDTPEWQDARRDYITSSAIPVILGLSPYRCEEDLADEMSGTTAPESDPKRERMLRLGHSLEAVIRDEDEREHGIKLRSVNRFIVSPTIPWAATSLDFERVGERCIVEAKSSRARRWEDGLPQDVEAQVRWQMGVAGYPKAHVAVLRHGSELECFDVEHDGPTFDGLVTVAADFWARYQAGGPFAQSDRVFAERHPRDNAAAMVADDLLTEHCRRYYAVGRQIDALKQELDHHKSVIKGRMGDFARLDGPGFHATLKRTKDTESTDWEALAADLLNQMPEPERIALVGLHTTVRQGFRPLRVYVEQDGGMNRDQ